MSSLESLQLYSTSEHPCSYLPEQQAETLFIDPSAQINASLYSQLSRVGFRRSGDFVYRPACKSCAACIPTRVPVQLFRCNRSQRRVLRRGQSISIEQVTPRFDDEHYQLYQRYISVRHRDGDMYPPSPEQFKEFLLNDGFNTRFIEFRDAGKLIAAAVTDQLDDAWSAVYTYFEPELNRYSLGVLTLLKQIEGALDAGCDYLYLGYWIKDCQKMNYKLNYRPIEVLVNNRWSRLD